MRDKLDLRLVRTLLKKQWIERTYGYKRGNFDIVGFILRLLLIAAFMAVFIIFFGKFTDIYISIKTDNALNVNKRAFELFTMVYTVIIVFMTISAVSQINREIFAADDVKIFSAMPVGAKSLFVAKLLIIYFSQLTVAIIAVLAVNITIAIHVPQTSLYYLFTALTCILLPLITIAIASVLALPFNMIKRLLQGRFVITFILVTAIAGVLFYAYSIILGAVKDMLLGDSLRYFFDEKKMNAIGFATSIMYPAKWLANIMTGTDRLLSGVWILITLAVCIVLSMVLIRYILQGALQSRIAGTTSYIKRGKTISKRSGGFWALVKKDFLLIFRTPSYMFSYFSVAVIMPLMVYFCMSIGSSLVLNLVGLECNLELSIFLTLLFGALTNVFCATNVSRDGEMFYSVKALPLSYKTVFFSKIFLCMAVTALSQMASAILICCTGFVPWYVSLFLFFTGTLFSFVHICVATRYDFNHARFSTEDDGEIKESGNVISTIIVLGMLISIAVGGAVFIVRILMLLRQIDLGYLSYLIAGGSAIVAAVIAYLYFIRKLGDKYYEFDGGGI